MKNDDKRSESIVWPILLFVAIGAASVSILVFAFHHYCLAAKTPALICEVIKTKPPWTSLTALATAPVLILIWYWRVKHKRIDIRNETQRQITERFVQAVRLLADKSLEARLGGIYSLERISRDSQDDHWTVVETLAAFIREKRKIPKSTEKSDTETESSGKDVDPVPTDIQAALTVLGRRKWAKSETGKIDLKKTNLQDAHLYKANLQNTNLQQANQN